MKAKHKAALERLRKALDACHKAGLRGGVYEGSFYAWPADAKPDPRDTGWRFFETIREVGGDAAFSEMMLDGGAGV